MSYKNLASLAPSREKNETFLHFLFVKSAHPVRTHCSDFTQHRLAVQDYALEAISVKNTTGLRVI